jgi:hypothetical protein
VPSPGTHVSAFLRRDALDKVMFGWVRAFARALPGVSRERALSIFAHEFGIEAGFNPASWRKRYEKMEREFYDDQKTAPLTPQANEPVHGPQTR